MPKTFHITAPDGHVLEITGPDDATEEQALAQAQAQYKPKAATVPPIRPLAPIDPIAGQSTFGSRAREAAIGALEPFTLPSLIDTVKAAGRAGYEGLKGNVGPLADLAKSAVMAPIQPVQNFASGISEGDYDKAAYGAGGMLTQTAPAVAATANLAKVAVPGAKSLAGDMASRLYESALKPGPRSNTLPEVQRMVQTGLTEGIPVSEKGVRKLTQLQGDLNTDVQSTIAAGNAGARPINKFSVASRLSDVAKRFSSQVNPETDLASVSQSGNEFLRNQPADISPLEAQKLKQGTYQQLKSRSFGELKNADVESQKALARGLKEEIEARFPNVKDMNARASNLYGLQDELEAAVNRSRNREMFGLGTPLVTGAVGAATGSLPEAIIGGTIKSILDKPQIKSRIAIALSRMSR